MKFLNRNNKAITGLYVCVYICIYIHGMQGNMMVSGITRMYGEQGQVSYRRSKGYMQGRQGLWEHIHTYTYTCQAHLHLHLQTYTYTCQAHLHLHLHTHLHLHIHFCVLCVCVSERRHSDCSSVHLLVKMSVCPSVCLGCFFPLSVGLSACLSRSHSVYSFLSAL